VNVLGHADVAPRRKNDPSRHFPWRRLAAEGFGLWCDDFPPAPADFDAALALRAFGYDTRDLAAAVAAFKRRYAPQDPGPELSERDRGMLRCLLDAARRPALR
jgi:N-acetylmuramoyl-L-alanine amidase